MEKQKILNFIQKFKTRNGEVNQYFIEEFFLKGSCYWFAKILSERFSGKILYDIVNNHFLFYGGYSLDIVNNGIFDIRGDVTEECLSSVLDGSIVEWNLYNDTTHKKRIWRDCVVFEEEEEDLPLSF